MAHFELQQRTGRNSFSVDPRNVIRDIKARDTGSKWDQKNNQIRLKMEI